MAMKVIRVEIGKKKLLSIPEVEYTFFLALGHVSNEINAITKMLFWAAKSPANTEAEEHGRYMMIHLFFRLLAGKLNEAWELFRKNFFGTALSHDYEPILAREVTDALRSLKRYFSSANAVNHIRNNFAFHYSPSEVSAVLPQIDDKLLAHLWKVCRIW